MATLYIVQWERMARGSDGAAMPIPSGFRGAQALTTSATKASSNPLTNHTRYVELCSLDSNHVWDVGTSPDADNAGRAKPLPQNVLGFYEVRGGDTISAKTA